MRSWSNICRKKSNVLAVAGRGFVGPTSSVKGCLGQYEITLLTRESNWGRPLLLATSGSTDGRSTGGRDVQYSRRSSRAVRIPRPHPLWLVPLRLLVSLTP